LRRRRGLGCRGSRRRSGRARSRSRCGGSWCALRGGAGWRSAGGLAGGARMRRNCIRARMRRHSTRRHSGPHRRRRHICHFDEFNVEDEVRLGRNARMVGTVRHGARSVGELPGNKDAALAANLHAGEAVIKARDDPAHTLRKLHGLRILHLGLAVGPKLRLAIFADRWLRVLVPRVEFDAVGGAPAGVLDMPELACLAFGARADLDVLVVQRDGGLERKVRNSRHAGRQLDPRWSRGGTGGSRGLGSRCD
jgi:hypothetical protein